MSKQSDLPSVVDNWTKDEVKKWVVEELRIDEKFGELLYCQDVSGLALTVLTKQDLIDMGITAGPACLILHKRDKRKMNQVMHTNQEEGRYKSTKTKNKSSKKNKNMNVEPTEAHVDTPDVVTLIDSVDSKGNESGKDTEDVLKKTTVSKESKTEQISDYNCVSKNTCQPYPFNNYHETYHYVQHNVLPSETGRLNLIDPVHEFKLFTNTQGASEKDVKMKFSNEVFRFASACMNSRTNGTIHFGVGDKNSGLTHGEIMGVQVSDKSMFIDHFYQSISSYFEKDNVNTATDCIRPPRFVEVFCQNNTNSEKFVIEVDVEPKHSICKSDVYFTYCYMQNETDGKWIKSKEQYLFIRDGASSRNILQSQNEKQKKIQYENFLIHLQSLVEQRIAADNKEPKKLSKNDEGPRLKSIITGNRKMLDNSYYEWYILVINKGHPSQEKYLEFLKEIKWFAVLEFDPESVKNGVCKFYQKNRIVNLHFPYHFQDTNSSCDTVEKLNLYTQLSWIFCNGRSDLAKDKPLQPNLWFKERASEVRKVISFLCQPDIMPQGKFLVVFLLLSQVGDQSDPMFETLHSFYQELKGAEDIVCICDSEQTFLTLNDLIKARGLNVEELTDRCISKLSLDEINATILNLKSVTRSSRRFLPPSKIIEKKDEDVMTTLKVLCENECEDTEVEKHKEQFAEFQKSSEEHFYKGGKATWWNFYFAEKGYSGAFIKRDNYGELEDLINLWCQTQKQICVKIISLFHHPGCGGTALAMHILWELRKKFRCAVLINKAAAFDEIGRQVVFLLTYRATNQSAYLPVLLLVDDLEEQENVHMLLKYIQEAAAEKNLRNESPLVIILNCMRSQDPDRSSKNSPTDSVSLKHELSPIEQRLFEAKLKEIEEQHNCPHDFYSFMIMKTNFDKAYIDNVVKNTLKGLYKTSKQARLISFLALLNSFVKNSSISVSQCENYLGIVGKKTYWGSEQLEDRMGSYSTLLLRTEEEEWGRYQGIQIIHPRIASGCLEELSAAYDLSKSEITKQLLSEDKFYELGIGRNKLLQDIQSMLITRQRKEHGDEADTFFSPLIEAILHENEGTTQVEKVLVEATERFDQNPFISQALARHFIKEKNFEPALNWAKRANKQSLNNSYVTDTLGKVFKNQFRFLKEELENAKRDSITVEELKQFLHLADSGSKAFQQSQELSETNEDDRTEWQKQGSKRKYDRYNTAGYLGEIEIGLYTIDVLGLLPFLKKSKNLNQDHISQYLSGKFSIDRLPTDSSGQKYQPVLSEYNSYLSQLGPRLKKAFDFFDEYFVYFKPRNIEKETVDSKRRSRVSDYYEKYKAIFCQSFDESCTFSVSDKHRKELEFYKADKFSGLLGLLGRTTQQDVKILEDVVGKYKILVRNPDPNRSVLRKDKQNFILANIVLKCIKPSSKQIASDDTLKQHLRDVLKDEKPHQGYTEPYFLASLLFWPTGRKIDQDSKRIEKYVSEMRKIGRGKYRKIYRSKHPIAHFYLGGKTGLNKLTLIHKTKIDKCFSGVRDLNSLWQSGDIWKEKEITDLLLRLHGRTEDGDLYVEYDLEERIEIPVRPAYLGQLRSGRSIEKVSFYLGFSIDGPIAYDIQST
uniref:SAM domain-containing protein n=1 Tax=Latimeria chalumnae TaxID=7897 RepID=H3A404_LATCH